MDGSLELAVEDVTDFADVTLVCDCDSQNESRKSPGLFPWIAGCQSKSTLIIHFDRITKGYISGNPYSNSQITWNIHR